MRIDPRTLDSTARTASIQFYKAIFRSFFILDRDFSHPFSDKFFRLLFNEGMKNLFPNGHPATEKQFTRLLNSFTFEVFDPVTKTMQTTRLNRVAAGRNRRYLYLNIQPCMNEAIALYSNNLVERLSPDHPFRAADPLSLSFVAALQERGVVRELGDGLRSRKILKWRKEAFSDKITSLLGNGIQHGSSISSYAASNPLFPYAAFINDRAALVDYHLHLLDSDTPLDKSEKIV
jgi:hypothetical protein